MIAVSITLNPKENENIEQWNSQYLWKPMTNDEMIAFIKEIQQTDIKSGSILCRDEDGEFKTISFRKKKINEPKTVNANIRIKSNRTKKQMTFEEKLDALTEFITANNRAPRKDEVVDGFHVGTFYNSIIKNRNKYQEVIDDLGVGDVIAESLDEAVSEKQDEEEGSNEVVVVEEEEEEEEVKEKPKRQTKNKRKL